MKTAGVFDAKTHVSELIESGENVAKAGARVCRPTDCCSRKHHQSEADFPCHPEREDTLFASFLRAEVPCVAHEELVRECRAAA
jgi:hypothetical protein